MALTISDEGLENIQLSAEIQQKALQKAKEGYVIALLELGEISSGRAAQILGVSRLEMIEMMNQWGISIFDDSQTLEELRQEVEQAELILN
jgi:predicted HTH domain antitoxin